MKCVMKMRMVEMGKVAVLAYLVAFFAVGNCWGDCLGSREVTGSFEQVICPGAANERTVTKTATHTVYFSTPGCDGEDNEGGEEEDDDPIGGGPWFEDGNLLGVFPYNGGSGNYPIPPGTNSMGIGDDCFYPGCTDKSAMEDCEECTQSSVILTNGTYNFTETDLKLPARAIPVIWARHYRSNRVYRGDSSALFGEPLDGPLGYGWMTPYFARIENGDTYVDGQGLYTTFEKDAAGNFLTDQNNGLILKKVATGYELAEMGGHISRFGLDGKLQSISDRLGNRVRLDYDGEGRLSAVIDATGRTALTFIYNAGGRIETVTDAAGRSVGYTYDAFGNLSDVDGLGESGHTYTYNTYHGLLTKANSLGETVTVTYAYPDRGVLETVVDPIGSALLAEGRQPTGHVKSFAYDFSNSAFYVTDANGTVTRTTANSEGRLTSKVLIQADGNVVLKKIQYNEDRSEVITDAAGNQTIIQRDEWRNIVRVTDGEGGVTRISYNSQRRPTKITDPLGIITTFAYDATGTHVVRKTEAMGAPVERVTTYDYSDYGELESVTVGGATMTLAYGDSGLPESYTDPLGNKTLLTFDVAGHLRELTDANGNRTILTYDELGKVLNVTDPMEQVTQYAYNSEGRLEKVTDALGRETLVETDFDEHILAVIDALQNRTDLIYDADGNLLSVTRGEAVTTFSYDGTDRLASVTDAEGNVTSYTYADAGCSSCGASSAIPETVTDPFGNVTKSLFDKTGRVIGVQDPLGNLTDLAYDAKGQVIRQIDANGNITRFEYDALGRQTKQIDAEGGETLFTYDLRDNLLTLTDPEQHTTTFEYDLAGRKSKEIRPMGQVTEYTYDPNGLVKTVKDAKGQVTTYVYDKANRLIEVTYADGTHDTFSYDAVGNLTGYANPDVSGTLTYDELNHKLSETIDYGSFQKTFSYTYDGRGNKATYTSPEGQGHVYTYRKNDQLKTVTVDGKTFGFDYDHTRLSKLTFPNGVVTDYAYNANSWLTGINTTGPGGAILTRTYAHDAVGNVRTKDTEHGLYAYGYDRVYQLTDADNPSLEDEAYTYDKGGNRLTSLTTASLWSYSANNELISDTFASYEYDANGNTVKKTEGGQTTIYEYNARNRLNKVYLPDGRVATYAYDPFGRRIRKQVANTVTWFVYVDEGLVGEYSDEGVFQKAYGWRPSGLWGTDPLYMVEGGSLFFYHNDHLGTPQRLTDDAGAVVWSAGYGAFGLAVVDVASTVENNLRFPGQYFDAETGLHYNWRRMYEPVAGRYIQVDPIGFGGGDLNIYRYVQQNPVCNIDPTGKYALEAVWTGFLVDLSIPDPSDLAPPKWVGWAAGLAGAAVVDAGIILVWNKITGEKSNEKAEPKPIPEPKTEDEDEDEDDREKACREKLKEDEMLCKQLVASTYGCQGLKICNSSAMIRFSECLRFGVLGIRTPLHGVHTQL